MTNTSDQPTETTAAADESPSTTDAMLRTLSLLTPLKPLNVRKIRTGGPNDGGYVMVDTLDGIDTCYSIGTGPDISWDVYMADRYNAKILQFDHTVEPPPPHPLCTFHQMGVSDNNDEAPTLKRLDTIFEESNHTADERIILKIDVEGAEWAVFDSLSEAFLDRFEQIVLEVHSLADIRFNGFRETVHRVLSKITHSHAPVHVHANNYAPVHFAGGIPIPIVMEASFVNRRLCSLGPSDEVFPTPLDSPCDSNAPDIFLGSFKFI